MIPTQKLVPILLLLPLCACTAEVQGEGQGDTRSDSAPAKEGAAPKTAPAADAVPKDGASDATTAATAEEPAQKAIKDFIAAQKIDKTRANWKTSLPKPPQASFDSARTYTWVLETSEGVIKVKLLPQVAPMHVSSTMYLTELGFYDGLTFHRVIPGFMAQGGCPVGRGTGGPGYEYAGEFSPDVRHTKPGLLSMANRGANTDGSQFFLTFVPTPNLDGKHTIFGEVSEGMDVVKTLEKFGTPPGPPTKPLTIVKARIEVK